MAVRLVKCVVCQLRYPADNPGGCPSCLEQMGKVDKDNLSKLAPVLQPHPKYYSLD